MTPLAAKWLVKVRECALALPESSERLSHGAISFFVKKTKCFLNFTENHHGDGRLAIWARLDKGISLKKVKAIVEQAWRVRAPKSLVT